MCEVTEHFLLFLSGAVVDKSSGKVLVVQDRNKVPLDCLFNIKYSVNDE